MQEVLILAGIPASGKSTAARDLLKASPNFRRLNKDDLRHTLGYVNYDKQSFIDLQALTKEMLRFLLKQGHSVVVDNTNLKWASVRQLIDVAEDHTEAVKVSLKLFDVDLQTALNRNSFRGNEERVPDEIIENMFKSLSSSRAKLLELQKNPIIFEKIEPVVQDIKLPYAVICDLDGTLADISWRNPYDASQCDKDKCVEAVRVVIEKLQFSHKIIFVSGREDKYRSQTLTFLENNIEEPYDLFMRQSGDTRRDSQVKKQIFEENIKGRYFVEFVMDDRNSVVNLWRKLGLKTFQVAPGDF